MPNGHGGSVRFFSVGVLVIILAVNLVAYHKSGEAWVLYAGYALSALLGERFAHHLHRWNSEEYDGAYYSDAEKAGARKIYIVAAILYVIGAVVAWNFLTTK
jgi:hypothetical protein